MNRKKVGLLTFFNRLNCGAELQAYALHKTVKDLGYDCEILDVLSPKHPSAKKPELYKSLSASRKMYSVRTCINNKLARILGFFAAIWGWKVIRTKKERFEKFKRDYLTVSGREYYSVDDLYNQKMPYDIFITGSDQIWNPQMLSCSPEPYFLTFVQKDKKKISYAASFGVSSIPNSIKDKYAQWLSNIDYLSVREKQGADIVREITGRTAEVVLDPTFLVRPENWNEIAVDPKFKKPYILLYVRIYSPYITKLAYYLSQKTGYSIVRIARGNSREGLECKIKNLFDVGPSEFLGLFKNASFVLSASFHGTAFAINYNKPFYVILRERTPDNSRLVNILNCLNLNSRMLSVGDAFPKEEDMPMNFSEANIALEKEREKSLSFLKRALES